MTLRKLLASFAPADVVTVGFLLFLTMLNLLFHARVSEWLELTAANLTASFLICYLAYSADTRETRLMIGLHRWYLYLVVLLIFKELYFMIRPIHPVDYDGLLIAADRWIFGTDPTVWMSQFSHPILTEILQIA